MNRRRYMRVVFWIWGATLAALAIIAAGKAVGEWVVGWI